MYTVAQVKAVMEYARVGIIKNTQVLERYEAMLVSAPQAIATNFAEIRDEARRVVTRLRQNLAALDGLLRRDEEVNGWKGEDREVEYIAE